MAAGEREAASNTSHHNAEGRNTRLKQPRAQLNVVGLGLLQPQLLRTALCRQVGAVLPQAGVHFALACERIKNGGRKRLVGQCRDMHMDWLVQPSS